MYASEMNHEDRKLNACTPKKKKDKRGFLASAWPLRILRGVHDIGRSIDSKRRVPTVDRTPVERRLNEMNLEAACTVVPPSLFFYHFFNQSRIRYVS